MLKVDTMAQMNASEISFARGMKQPQLWSNMLDCSVISVVPGGIFREFCLPWRVCEPYSDTYNFYQTHLKD